VKAKSSSDNVRKIEKRLDRLHAALAKDRSKKYCIHLWSKFIKERDDYRCINCKSKINISAHHICRKSFLGNAQFQTGNGITLCSKCHKLIHRGFNRRPDLSLPVDAQNGEKLSCMGRLYSILTDDAVNRGLIREDFYFLTNELLEFYKRMQGLESGVNFPGLPIEQAFLILSETEFPLRQAIAKANGVNIPSLPLFPGGLCLVFEKDGYTEENIVRTYKPRSTTKQ
jgi:hypothetical protein